MISEWFQRVGSSVPRGFSRYFILELLKEKTYTGKEIIDYAVEQSNGIWKPSPGLIYPLLGRLLDEKLIEETIPKDIRLSKNIELEKEMSESDFLMHLKQISSKNKVFKTYIGLGYNRSYLPAVIPETIVFHSVGTNLILTPISLASSLITSISNPLYLFVAGSFRVIGSQSPVVPTFNSPEDKI